MITSAANKKVKNVMLLSARAKERKIQGVFVAEGVKMFLEAPDDWIKEVYLSETFSKEVGGPSANSEKMTNLSNKLALLSRRADVTVETVKEDIFNKMCDTQTPQGVLCVLKMPKYDLSDILKRQKGLYLVLEDIQDPGNLGTMIRAGEGAGLEGVIMSSHTVDIFNPKTIRATMGSIYRVPFVYVADLVQSMTKMRNRGVQIYAAHLLGERFYDQEDYHTATAFLVGNEGNGLSREAADAADTYLKIPMLGKVESLNAAIAATLLMYEAARQRRN